MINPVHKVKRYVVYADGRPPHWTEDTVVGWLATRMKDRNGREIFEGDIVKGTYAGYIEFESAEIVYDAPSGSFVIVAEDDLYLNESQAGIVEVVGHIAERNFEKNDALKK